MGRAKIVIPKKKNTELTFEDLTEDDWFIDSHGDLCCKSGAGKNWITPSGCLCYMQSTDDYSKVTPVSVEITVKYDD